MNESLKPSFDRNRKKLKAEVSLLCNLVAKEIIDCKGQQQTKELLQLPGMEVVSGHENKMNKVNDDDDAGSLAGWLASSLLHNQIPKVRNVQARVAFFCKNSVPSKLA